MIKQKISEIEKGCGKLYRGVTDKDKCFSIPRFNNLCPTCKATLQAYLECEKIIKEEKIKMIDDELAWAEKQKNSILAEMEVAKKWNTNNARQSEIMLMMFLTQINKRLSQLQKLREDLR